MNRNVNDIKRMVNPHSENIDTSITWINTIFNFLIGAICFVGFFMAVMAASALADWAKNFSDDVAEYYVDYFGYAIKVESDSFVGTPFVLFLHIATIVALVVLVLFCVKMVVIAHLRAKIHIMDSLYRSERLNELLVINSEKEKNEPTGSQ